MKRIGELLPPHGIELKWIRGQSLIIKVLSMVNLVFLVCYNIHFKEIRAGCIVSGLEKDGMALPYMPQLLDRVPACEG